MQNESAGSTETFQSYLESERSLPGFTSGPIGLNQSLDRNYYSPMSETMNKKAFQTFLEEDTSLVRTYYSPLCSRKKDYQAQKLMACFGIDNIYLAYKMEMLIDVWIELVEIISNFLATKAGMGDDQIYASKRFQIANIFLATVFSLLIFTAAVFARLFLGQILGVAFCLLIVGAWINNSKAHG